MRVLVREAVLLAERTACLVQGTQTRGTIIMMAMVAKVSMMMSKDGLPRGKLRM